MEYSMDLNWSENNCNFNIDILANIFIAKFCEPISQPAIFKILTGAKGFGKSYLICLLALFYTCNFLDWNCLLARYTFISAKDNYDKKMTRVINDLSKYGVTIKESIDQKIIKRKSNDNRYELIWPNGRIIKVVGFDNGSAWEGQDAPIGEYAFFGLDEVIPLDAPIVDENEYMYRLFNMIIQISRGKNIVTTSKLVPELCYEDENVKMQLRKEQIIIFGFNNHNADHIIYETFVQSVFPLSDEVQKELDENDISYFNDPTYMENIGVTVIRGTTKVNNKNLNQRVFDLGNWLVENKPEIYDSLFRGGERQLNPERYSYKKDLLTGAKFFNPNEFYWKDMEKYWFSFIAIGADYADSIQGKDDAVQILVGIELDENDNPTEIYILEEQSISSAEFKDMTKKVASMSNKINEWSLKYHKLKEELKYRIGHDARTVGDFVREKLIINHGWDEKTLENSFSRILVTGEKGWKVVDRHFTIKRLLATGRIYFSNNLKVTKLINGNNVVVKKYGYLYDELYNCKNYEKSNIRDERPGWNKLDAINAFECILSFFRFNLFEN